MTDYQPNYDDNGVAWCSRTECPLWQPSPQRGYSVCGVVGVALNITDICRPWALDAARDNRAMDMLRRSGIDHLEWDEVWNVGVGKRVAAVDSDPATAIIKAAVRI
jgi:hypothetical protein